MSANLKQKASSPIAGLQENSLFSSNYRSPWSEEEKELLRSLFNEGKKETEIAAILNRSISSIGYYKSKLGLKRAAFWTVSEITCLKRLYATPGISRKEIALRLGKTEAAVQSKAAKLRLKHSCKWSQAEIDFLLEITGTAPRRCVYETYAQWASRSGYPVRKYEAIYDKLKSLSCADLDGSADWFTRDDIAAALGANPEAISQWFSTYKQELKPECAKKGASGGGYCIARSRFRSFLLNHPSILERYRSKLDFVFLTDLFKYSYD